MLIFLTREEFFKLTCNETGCWFEVARWLHRPARMGALPILLLERAPYISKDIYEGPKRWKILQAPKSSSPPTRSQNNITEQPSRTNLSSSSVWLESPDSQIVRSRWYFLFPFIILRLFYVCFLSSFAFISKETRDGNEILWTLVSQSLSGVRELINEITWKSLSILFFRFSTKNRPDLSESRGSDVFSCQFLLFPLL